MADVSNHNRLADYRCAAGFSQQELADKAGVTRSLISALECNISAPSASSAGRICVALSEALGFRVYTWDAFPGHFKDVRGGAA